MSSSLRLDWCSYEAAEFAVKHWHYSRRLPAGKAVHIGAWEDARYIGAVVFSHGNNNHIGSPFGLDQTEVCELTRVALREHRASVSRIVALAVKMLRRQSPGLRLIVSYADPVQGHHGGIYQALGWTYAGNSRPQRELRVGGARSIFLHKRSASARFGTASPERIRALTGLDVIYGPVEWKHTYYLPLDPAMRAQIAPLAKPYPKRVRSEPADTAGVQPAEGGAAPTLTLQETTV